VALKVYVNDQFPDEVRLDLRTVAREVAEVVTARMGPAPPEDKPVVCYPRSAGPMTSLGQDARLGLEVYRVGLTVTTREYRRFAYQLGHELGHVMMGARRTNGPIEVVAVALSLVTLGDMAERWQVRAPYPEWQSYADAFRRYRGEVERQVLDRSPREAADPARAGDWDRVGGWLRTQRQRLVGDVEARDLQHLAAMYLLARGGRGALPFKDYWGLAGITDPPPSRDPRYRSDLPLDPRRIPTALRQLVA
jgi:hypothetical protein